MKTSNILILGGLAVAAYFLLKQTQGSPGADTSGGGAVPPPVTGPGSTTSSEGLFTQTPGQETLFFKGLGYSVRESNVQAMVNQLAGGYKPVAVATTPQAVAKTLAQAVYSGAGGSSLDVAKTYYSGGYGIPSKPADIMTGQSIGVGIGSPFIPSVTAKPIGFK